MTANVELLEGLAVIKAEVEDAPTFVTAVTDGVAVEEASLVAVAVLAPSNDIDAEEWAALVLEQEQAYGADGSSWSPPKGGAWAAPYGAIHTTVRRIGRQGSWC